MAVVILMISLTITRNTKNKKHSDNADLEAYDQEAQGRFLSVKGSPIDYFSRFSIRRKSFNFMCFTLLVE